MWYQRVVLRPALGSLLPSDACVLALQSDKDEAAISQVEGP